MRAYGDLAYFKTCIAPKVGAESGKDTLRLKWVQGHSIHWPTVAYASSCASGGRKQS
jgi:hypothetical protein